MAQEPNDLEGINIAQLQQELQEQNAGWQAAENPITSLPYEEKLVRLGVPLPPNLEDIKRQASSAIQTKSVGAPAAFDLRNVSGKNFITSVKNQGGCGSCVAFGVVATIEGTMRFQRNDATLAVDLSEAHLFYCHGRAVGRNCGNGWLPAPALDSCRDVGVVDDACYPYTAVDQNCTGRCADWANRVTKISGYVALTNNRAGIKEHISTKGPVGACFIVYDDFFAYRSGVYKHVSGGEAGGHCVSIVGYNDAQNAWICKNSWGASWGDGGYFRIAYGDSLIDSWQNHGVTSVEELWQNNKRVVGLWAINQDRNAWAYIEGIGWRRIANDNDNIFFNLLIDLTAAKSANRPVNVFIEGGLIKEVYVL